MLYDLIVIGAGAGGCFAAIRLAELQPGAKILVLEAARKPLGKVEISGGGRCNVTHACFDPKALIQFYPRGGEYLLPAFSQFHPGDLIAWFKSKSVRLKTEQDGRVFPATDSSATIIDCFMAQFQRSRIELKTSTRAITWYQESKGSWSVELMNGDKMIAKHLLVSAGSDQRTWDKLKLSGHHIIDPVPSLFTFNIRNTLLNELQGISMPSVKLTVPDLTLQTDGPILITHWGLSGPSILKMSAWGARELYRCGYVFDVHVNWLNLDKKHVSEEVKTLLLQQPKKWVSNLGFKNIPSRLWKYFCLRAGITEMMNSSEIGKSRLEALINCLVDDIYRVTGKSTFKEEFVTAGGVSLEDIDVLRFESKLQPNLFLVGEVLNIDALTGGFNFQAAWTGGELVARAIKM